MKCFVTALVLSTLVLGLSSPTYAIETYGGRKEIAFGKLMSSGARVVAFDSGRSGFVVQNKLEFWFCGLEWARIQYNPSDGKERPALGYVQRSCVQIKEAMSGKVPVQ
jgi:hypothetical protein